MLEAKKAEALKACRVCVRAMRFGLFGNSAIIAQCRLAAIGTVATFQRRKIKGDKANPKIFYGVCWMCANAMPSLQSTHSLPRISTWPP